MFQNQRRDASCNSRLNAVDQPPTVVTADVSFSARELTSTRTATYLTKQVEYETVWAHGANCGIDDIDAIAMLDRLDVQLDYALSHNTL